MELTNELKARFFALYWGQRVLFNVPASWERFEVSSSTIMQLDYHDYLELRPLSSITEEEARELAIADFVHHPDEDLVSFVDQNMQHIIDFRNSSDYLRSKGFLLPFMGIPSDQWVEWGVVKLKTE